MSEMAGTDIQPPRREKLSDLAASRPFFENMADVSDLPEGVSIETHTLRERDGVVLTAEVYRPEGTGPHPVVVHFHGGGYCVGSVRADRKLAMQQAARGYVVVSPDYGLAPENPFPWAVEDCLYTTRWAAREFGSEVVLEGGSAGAGLAAAVMNALLGEGGELDAALDADLDAAVDVRAVVLLYGMLSFPLLYSHTGSNVGSVELWHRGYLGPHYTTKVRDPLASPLYTQRAAGWPATYLSCGAEDSFLRHTTEMAVVLAEAGVPTTVSVVAGLDHGYAKSPKPAALAEMARIREWIDTMMEVSP
jgi:acetyl esterase